MISYTETIKKWAGFGKEEFLRAVSLAFTKFFSSGCDMNVAFAGRKIEWYINDNKDFIHRWSTYDNNPYTYASFLGEMFIQGDTIKK